MSSAGIRRAISSATALLPDAVGPKIAMTGSATQARPSAGDLLVAHAGGAQVGVDASVAPFQLAEDARDHLGRRLRDPLEPSPLRLRLGGLQPGVMAWTQALLAERVVRGDLVRGDSRDLEEQRRQQPGAVLAADTVDDDTAFRGLGDGPHRGSHVRLEALQEDQVGLTRGLGDRQLVELLESLRDLLPFGLARFHE